MSRIAPLGLALALVAAGAARPNSGLAETPTAESVLSPVDYNFVAQANLGAPFQIDSGRIAEQKATTAEIRDYAHLMVVTHIPVVDALNAVLQPKGITAPPSTLLQGAYNAMIASLKADNPVAFDRDYVDGQVEYRKGNAALFRYEIKNGADANLKDFARRTLPKIEDHLQRGQEIGQERRRHGDLIEVGACVALLDPPRFSAPGGLAARAQLVIVRELVPRPVATPPN